MYNILSSFTSTKNKDTILLINDKILVILEELLNKFPWLE